MTVVRMSAAVVDGSQFETVHYPDDEVLLRVTDNGNVQVVEYRSTDRQGPPAHSHRWDEIEYVIEGDVEFYVSGTWVQGGAGTVQMLPAGVAHSVRIPTGSARLLMVTIGAPFAEFSRELGALYASSAASPGRVVEIARRYGLRLESDPDD